MNPTLIWDVGLEVKVTETEYKSRYYECRLNRRRKKGLCENTVQDSVGYFGVLEFVSEGFDRDDGVVE